VPVDAEVFAQIYRREVGRCVATLVRVLGNIDLAEDAVADALQRNGGPIRVFHRTLAHGLLRPPGIVRLIGFDVNRRATNVISHHTDSTNHNPITIRNQS
jgi:hypothetical protein